MNESLYKKARYLDLCATEDSIPVFAQPWWLDVTVGAANWEIILVEKNNKIEAALPIYKKIRLGVVLLTIPPLTPALGPWLRPYSGRLYKVAAREKKLLTALYSELPKYDILQQNWHPKLQNWQPLYWMGFRQTTKYTFRLDDLSDTDKIWSNLHQNTRNDIRKATTRNALSVREAVSIEEFTEVCNQTFTRQGLTPPYSNEFLSRVCEASSKHDAVNLLVAEDGEGQLHAGAMILRDRNTAYYVMGGGDPQLRMSGAASQILWEAILQESKKVQAFDFEGSMIEPIEHFFRNFGSKQTGYFHITKTATFRGRVAQFAQQVKSLRPKSGPS